MKLNNPADLIVTNNKKQILLVKRAKTQKEFPDCWSFPGGGCETGETAEEAIKREIKEELNCKIKKLQYFKSYYYKGKGYHSRVLYFYGTISGKIKLQEKELSDFKWFELNNDLLKLKLAYEQEEVVKDFMKAVSDKLVSS
ncbi:NUDIX hydrolase [Candidatus Parcubacteria bacterium]|nr:MAG: NUDIX hydrolase [Candidatus Parcubacteria bacterium]